MMATGAESPLLKPHEQCYEYACGYSSKATDAYPEKMSLRAWSTDRAAHAACLSF